MAFKKITSLITAGVLALAVTACTAEGPGSTPNNTGSPTAPADGQLTVAFSFASCEGSGDDPVAKVELSTTISQIPEGIISSFPVTTKNGDWEIVQGLEIDDFSRGKIDATVAELKEEREAVKELGLI